MEFRLSQEAVSIRDIELGHIETRVSRWHHSQSATKSNTKSQHQCLRSAEQRKVPGEGLNRLSNDPDFSKMTALFLSVPNVLSEFFSRELFMKSFESSESLEYLSGSNSCCNQQSRTTMKMLEENILLLTLYSFAVNSGELMCTSGAIFSTF